MKIILLSGGSGKRLWPLSNDARSKQFIKLLENEDGHLESMVQRVWKQLEYADLLNSAYITTGKGQTDMIHSQLGIDVPIIIEPERRDTFPAIALAATYLYSIQGVSLDETITVLPVDPFVDNEFFQKIKSLDHLLEETKAELALIGVKPTYPSEKYGYIVPMSENSLTTSYQTISHFREKPPEDQAKLLIEQGALWNCGVFAFKLDYIINLLIERGLPIQYEEMVLKYSNLQKISFDYEVVEKAKHVVVTPYQGSWKDLGTWNTLTEEVGCNLTGKGMISEDSINSHIVNELDIPATIIGLSNVVVAISPDGILVSDKASSARIKDMMKNIEERPMYEERRWGWYKVLDYIKLSSNQHVLTKRIFIWAGRNTSYQLHHKRNEAWTIISGTGELILNEKSIQVHSGDVIQIPVRARHSLRAVTDIQLIEVQTGSELVEEDNFRLFMNWEEIVECLVK